MTNKTREAWLQSVIERLRPEFEAVDAPLPRKIRVSCGFPKARSTNVIGQCWCATASRDGWFELFISPVLDDPARVIDVLVHELVHAAVGTAAGHGPKFRRVAVALGLSGQMTATVASPELRIYAKDLVEQLGRYPHGRLGGSGSGHLPPAPRDPSGPDDPGDEPETSHPKQATRMVKVECPCCGYLVRTTRQWLKQGLPSCPAGTQMEADPRDLAKLGE